MRSTVVVGLLAALLGSLVGCAVVSQPPNPTLDERLRAYEATRSKGG
jgi:hypothetical protein